MAALAAVGSIMGDSQANRNLYQQQLGIVGKQKSANVNIRGEMKEKERAAGFKGTVIHMQEQRELAKHVLNKSTSNTAGASAAYAWINVMNQASIKQGNVVAERDAEKRDLGKRSQQLYNDSQSRWNAAESKKKSGMDMLVNAALAGASAYSAGKTMGADLDNYLDGAGGWQNLLFGNN